MKAFATTLSVSVPRTPGLFVTMLRNWWFSWFVGTALMAAMAVPGQTVFMKGHPVHPTRLLARCAPGKRAEAQAQILATHGLAVRERHPLVRGLVVLDLADAQAATALRAAPVDHQTAQLAARLEALRAGGEFDFVEPDYLVSADLTPADTAFADGTLWSLRNTGQNGGVSGVDVGAVEAWDLSTGSPNVIVAVIDTGIRYTHDDLAAQMWHNPGEIPGNGLDDDANGYVDDVCGLNAIAGSGDPMDDNSHGTHVAGTIGAAANDTHPHVGVAWRVRLMACKFLGADGYGYTSDAIKCINYAVQHGARILNN